MIPLPILDFLPGKTSQIHPLNLPNPMKTPLNPFISSALIATTIALQTLPVLADTYQWNGATSSDWITDSNWTGTAPADSTISGAHRLNVNSSTTLIYSTAQGTTNFTGDASTRGLVIGSGTSGTMQITGGTFSTLGAVGQDIIGNGNSSTGILTINGGNFIGTNAGTNLGIGTGTGRVSTLNVQSGSATMAGLTMNSTLATINLSGTGTLSVNSISKVSGATANINFDGGILQARASTTTFLTGLNTASVLSGGAKIDTNTFNITIGQSLLTHGTSTGGGLTKIGSGTLTLSGTNTYTGATTLSAGTLSIAASNNIGAAASNLVFDGGTLQITGTALANFSGIGHTVSFTSGKALGLDINSSTHTFTADQALSQGSGGFTKAGAGKLVLNQNNTYTGDTTISAGAIIKTAADATTGNISVTNGATFVLSGGITDGSGQSITINGPGSNTADYFYVGSAIQRGAIQAQSGTNTWQGNIVVTGTSNTRIGVQDGATLNLTGNISESSAGSTLAFRAGILGSDVVLSGTGSWTGITTFFSAGGSIRIAGNNRLSTASTAYFSSGGSTVFDLNSYNQEFSGIYSDGVTANANITNKGSSTNSILTSNTANATSFNYRGKISDDTGTVSLYKTGTGTQILTGNNTYTGSTTVNAGILAVDGSLANTSTTVQSGGTLRGSGSITGSVTVENGGIIAAGNSIESLQTGSLTLLAEGTFAQEINKDAASGVAGDLTSVNGGLTLDLSNAAILTLSELGTGAGTWDIGEKLTLLSYSGAWNGGLFSYAGNTLANGSTFQFSGADWQFKYNDTNAGTNYTADLLAGSSYVTMTVIPEPSASLLAVLSLLSLVHRRRK